MLALALILARCSLVLQIECTLVVAIHRAVTNDTVLTLFVDTVGNVLLLLQELLLLLAVFDVLSDPSYFVVVVIFVVIGSIKTLALFATVSWLAYVAYRVLMKRVNAW